MRNFRKHPTAMPGHTMAFTTRSPTGMLLKGGGRAVSMHFGPNCPSRQIDISPEYSTVAALFQNIWIYIYIYRGMYNCIYTYTYTTIHIPLYTHTPIHLYIYNYTITYTCTHVHLQLYIHRYIYNYTYTSLYTHTYMASNGMHFA